MRTKRGTANMLRVLAYPIHLCVRPVCKHNESYWRCNPQVTQFSSFNELFTNYLA